VVDNKKPFYVLTKFELDMAIHSNQWYIKLSSISSKKKVEIIILLTLLF